jgi:hypothetical protein
MICIFWYKLVEWNDKKNIYYLGISAMSCQSTETLWTTPHREVAYLVSSAPPREHSGIMHTSIRRTSRNRNYKIHTSSGRLGSAPAFSSNGMNLVYPPCPVANTRGDITQPLPLGSGSSVFVEQMQWTDWSKPFVLDRAAEMGRNAQYCSNSRYCIAR